MTGYAELMRHARYPNDPRTLAFAGVIATGLADGRAPLIRGISDISFRQLVRGCFPGIEIENGHAEANAFDEFDDLLDLLMTHCAERNELNDCLAHAIATAAMDNNHLWQDMGLPNRHVLSGLLYEFFPALAQRNVNDMKWKKFFYRQLCEASGIVICKAPNCAVCVDHHICFGPEEGAKKTESPAFVAPT